MENWILNALPGDERVRVLEHSTQIDLEPDGLLYEAGGIIDHVYFPQSGLVSLLATGENGSVIETGVVGREGMVGGVVTLGCPKTDVQAGIHIKGSALRVTTADFLRLNQSLSVLPRLVNRHIAFLLFQAQHNALCHVSHSVEERLCRWILQASDTLGKDLVEMTQETCSNSLGVQRTSVSMAAHALQVAGHIRTRRGKVHILNRTELERMACDCYTTVRQQSETVFAQAA